MARQNPPLNFTAHLAPVAVIRIGGSAPNSLASVTAMAAPVGVVSSTLGPRAYTGLPVNNSAVAGAGTGSTPCSVFIVPLPTLTGEL